MTLLKVIWWCKYKKVRNLENYDILWFTGGYSTVNFRQPIGSICFFVSRVCKTDLNRFSYRTSRSRRWEPSEALIASSVQQGNKISMRIRTQCFFLFVTQCIGLFVLARIKAYPEPISCVGCLPTCNRSNTSRHPGIWYNYNVVNRHRFDADPDLTFHFDTEPDSDPDHRYTCCKIK